MTVVGETPLRVPWPQVRRSWSFLLVALMLVAMVTDIAAVTIDEALATEYASCYHPTSKNCSCPSIDLYGRGLSGALPSDLGLCTDLQYLCVHPRLAWPLFASAQSRCKPTPRHAPRPHLMPPPRHCPMRSAPARTLTRRRRPLLRRVDPRVRFPAGVGPCIPTVSMARCLPSTAR